MKNRIFHSEQNGQKIKQNMQREAYSGHVFLVNMILHKNDWISSWAYMRLIYFGEREKRKKVSATKNTIFFAKNVYIGSGGEKKTYGKKLKSHITCGWTFSRDLSGGNKFEFFVLRRRSKRSLEIVGKPVRRMLLGVPLRLHRRRRVRIPAVHRRQRRAGAGAAATAHHLLELLVGQDFHLLGGR